MNDNWINVSERLPDKDRIVLVYAGDVYLGRYCNNLKTWYLEESDIHAPTHWMELPKAPGNI